MASKDGQVYPNNTVFSLSGIFGITSNYSILCVTEKRPCCSDSNRAGDWYYQNGTAVPSYGRTFAFYTSRGDDGTVRLHTRDNNISLVNTSQFCCELLNENDLSQMLCINIYNSVYDIMTEPVTETTTLTVHIDIPSVTMQVTAVTDSSNSVHVGAIIGSVATICVVLLCTLIIIAIALWKYCSLNTRTILSQNLYM